MGRSMGFEPTTSGTTNRRSNQLSYDRHRITPHRMIGTADARFCRMSAIWEAESCGTKETPAEAIRRGSRVQPRSCDQNFAPTETVTVAGAAQPWKNTVGSDCVR